MHASMKYMKIEVIALPPKLDLFFSYEIWLLCLSDLLFQPHTFGGITEKDAGSSTAGDDVMKKLLVSTSASDKR